jgi:hypothetical protein
MGYDIRLYIGERSSYVDKDNGCAVLVHAMVDLCKTGPGKVYDLDHESTTDPVYFYGHDGNTRISVDDYDNPLRMHDAKTVLNALYHDNSTSMIENGGYYRCFNAAIALIKAMMADFPELYVVFFAH